MHISTLKSFLKPETSLKMLKTVKKNMHRLPGWEKKILMCKMQLTACQGCENVLFTEKTGSAEMIQ